MVLNLINTNYGLAGRIYAKYIAMNYNVLQQAIVQAMDVLGNAVHHSVRPNVTSSPRWACVLVGARHRREARAVHLRP